MNSIHTVPGAYLATNRVSTRDLQTVVKQSRLEADHSLPPNTTVKDTWSYTSIPLYTIKTVCLIMQRQA